MKKSVQVLVIIVNTAKSILEEVRQDINIKSIISKIYIYLRMAC